MEDFYNKLAKRPLLDVIQEAEEEKYWQKSFENSNDITLYSWRNPWIKNMQTNIDHFGYFNRDHSVKVFFNELLNSPILIVGAGPSLEGNLDKLKMAKDLNIPIMCSHHTLMYLSREEYRIKPDYVVALDAGAMWGDYFGDLEFFADVPLLVDQTCDTDQLKKWKGPVYFFRSTMPESSIGKMLKMELERICPSSKWGSLLEVGGHVTGAMLSLAKGVMAANQILFAGTDYCFKGQKFYPFDHKIDQVVDGKDFGAPGQELPAPPPIQGNILDIFGEQVATNGSYLGFKNVMDMALKAHGINALQTGQEIDFYNCCEGGTLGALAGGNSKWMHYTKLEDGLIAAKSKWKLKGG